VANLGKEYFTHTFDAQIHKYYSVKSQRIINLLLVVEFPKIVVTAITLIAVIDAAQRLSLFPNTTSLV